MGLSGLGGATGGYTGPGMPDITQVPNASQPDTNNYLTTNYFRLVFGRLPTMSYMCQSVNVPDFSLGISLQQTPLGIPVKRVGTDYAFSDLSISFLVDEKMDNWREIFNWMTSIAHYESNLPVEKGGKLIPEDDFYSDARILVTNSSFQPQKEIIFRDVLPINLGGWEFTSVDTDATPVVSTASFSFTSYGIFNYPAQRRGDSYNVFTPPDAS